MHRSCFVFVTLIAFVAGCGGEPEEPSYPDVTGKVTLDGKPLVGATVLFVPTGANVGNRASATTDEAGTYKLQGPRGSTGAAPGEYRVAVSLRLRPDGTLPPPEAPKAGSGASETLPASYSDSIKTSLKATVPAQGGTFDFALKKRGASVLLR